jgi:FMN-dependent NADH-azoreductase
MKLLHVVATPRGTESATLRVSHALLERLESACPGVLVETLDLFTTDLPDIAGQNVDVKYGLMAGQAVSPSGAGSWRDVEELIHQFMDADVCLISAPMWNFHIPYVLKYYIDAIVQPGYLFSYGDDGVPVGRCQGKTLVCVTSRGSDYSTGSPMHVLDLQEPYLRAIFGFVGIDDIEFINVQPIDMGPERSAAAVADGIEAAVRLADHLASTRPALVGGRLPVEPAPTRQTVRYGLDADIDAR